MPQKGEMILDDFFSPDQYIDMKLSGLKDDVVADKVGVAITTLDRWKTAHGITMRLVNKARYNYMMDRLRLGHKIGDIARDLFMTKRNAHYILRKYGGAA